MPPKKAAPKKGKPKPAPVPQAPRDPYRVEEWKRLYRRWEVESHFGRRHGEKALRLSEAMDQIRMTWGYDTRLAVQAGTNEYNQALARARRGADE